MNRRLRHLVRSLTCRRRPRADFGKLLSCSVRVRGCLGNALRNADPRQFFGAPDMQVRRDPGWVIERAGLDERDRAVCRAVAVEVGAAVATEESIERLAARAAMILVATRTAAHDLQAVLGHGDVHRECGAGVLAAGLAVADHLHQRLSVRAVAHGTTEATSLDRRHRFFLPAGSPQRDQPSAKLWPGHANPTGRVLPRLQFQVTRKYQKLLIAG